MKSNFKRVVLYAALFFLVVNIASVFYTGDNTSGTEIKFSDFLKKVEDGEVKSVSIKGNFVSGKLSSDDTFFTYALYYDGLIESLRNNNVEIKAIPLTTKKSEFIANLLSWSPLILIGIFYYWSFKNMTKGGNNPFGFAKSKARMLPSKNKIMFKDVAGIEEAKGELKEIVDFLKDPEKYTAIGAKIPRGCLLIGDPGTGKTLLAKAIAGEANVPFFFISGSDFVEMFVGVGASRVRDMFTDAKKNAPCIIFIDEIDAVGRHRGHGIGGGNDEREQTLNQLLVEMDGFEGNEGVIVIAATNREDVLDKALLRPGRFDRQIRVQLPDIKGREEILQVHAQKVKMAPNIELKMIAKSTPGFSGAELANIINEGALLAARNNRKVVTNEDIEEATERVIMGVKNQSKIMKEEEKKITAYHEAGHAVCTLHSKNSDPIHKVTIISRGRAGGYVSRLPEYDKSYHTKAEILDNIVISMGGRVAEEIIFGTENITAGASSDIQAATYYAKNMITKWGMDEDIGAIFYANNLQYDDKYGSEACSDETLKKIDKKIKEILEEGKNKAYTIISSNKNELEIIAKALLKYETLTNDDITKLLNGEDLDKDKDNCDDQVISRSFIANILNQNKEE